jgi:hypothetical protein
MSQMTLDRLLADNGLMRKEISEVLLAYILGSKLPDEGHIGVALRHYNTSRGGEPAPCKVLEAINRDQCTHSLD